MALHIGVDVGGTFTDAIAIEPATGVVQIAKVPTTPENQAFGFLHSLQAMDVALADIDWLVHGTTVGTNAALEKKGAACGMITTEGFRDVVELGRRDRPKTYGLYGTFEPLVPRERRLEVGERMDAFGEVHQPLDEAAVEAAVRQLLDRGTESLVIAFLHSYANRAHEERAREIAERLWPNRYITTSAEVLGEFREFERFTTASLNAYLQPLIHRYVSRLREELGKSGVRRDLAIMQANGGISSADMAWKRAVGTVLSGPAAGVVAASHISGLAEFENVITCDMGGTSFDVGIIVDGKPVVSHDRELEYNMPVRLPIIDIHSIGAGGGSIASVNAAGIVQVGPRSAGAMRLVTLQRGHDPREFTVFAFGGAGPLHAAALARELGTPKVLVPYLPGIACALGCIVANVRHDFVQTVGRRIDEVSPADVALILVEQAEAGRALLEKDDVAVRTTEVIHEGDLQYEGQTYAMRVVLDPERLSIDDFKSRLRDECLQRFKIDLSEHPVRLVNLRTSVIGCVDPMDLKRAISNAETADSVNGACIGERKVWFDAAWRSTPVYQRNRLPFGSRFTGPAILNQTDSTTVIDPGDEVEIDSFGNWIITVSP